MRRRIALVLATLSFVGMVGTPSAGAPADVYYKPSGVAVIGGQAMASAETPPAAISYSASLVGSSLSAQAGG